MKRSRDQLARDALKQAENARLRDERAQEDVAQRQARKKKDKQEKFVEKWRSHLARWEEEGLVPLHALQLPDLVPGGVARSLFPRFPNNNRWQH